MTRTLVLVSFICLFLVSCGASETPTVSVHSDLDNLKEKASQVTLSLSELPVGFVEYRLDSDRMLQEENVLDVQSAFSFQTDSGNLQKIVGMTTIYPYSQRNPADVSIQMQSQIELLTRSMVKGFVFTKNVEVRNLVLDKPVGDVYSGKTFIWSNKDVGFPEYHTRTEILVFERNKITVILLFQYVDEFPVAISIEAIAHSLDRQIQDLET